jgi:hypothetical protein
MRLGTVVMEISQKILSRKNCPGKHVRLCGDLNILMIFQETYKRDNTQYGSKKSSSDQRGT